MIRNKKGDLKEEMPTVIIAVLGLVLIGLVAYKIYDATASQDEKSAKRLADLVEERINIASEGEERDFTFQGFGKKPFWYLCGWGESQQGIPEKCFPDSCVCVCPESSIPGESCQENGFCRKLEFEDIKVEPAYIFDSRQSIESYVAVGLYQPGAPSCIGILNNLFELGIKKTKDAVDIRYIA